jgi:hypothetical protein
MIGAVAVVIQSIVTESFINVYTKWYHSGSLVSTEG